MGALEPSAACDQLIKGTEQCRLTAYPDPFSPLGRATAALGLDMTQYTRVPDWAQYSGKPWTIGWGHCGPEVKPGLTIPQVWADHMYQVNRAAAAAQVILLTQGVDLTQGQLDSLTSLVYNCGPKILTEPRPAGSRLLAKLKAGDIRGAADEFLSDDHAGGKEVASLLKRRMAERRLFLYG